MKILSNKKYNEIMKEIDKLEKANDDKIEKLANSTKDIKDLKETNDYFRNVVDEYALEIDSLKKELKITKAKLTRAKKGNK